MALVALANGDGGTLRVSISPHDTTISHIDRLVQAALDIHPALITPLPKQTGDFVEVFIPPGMPNVYSTSNGRYVRREGDEIVTLPPRELRRLMMSRGELAFESAVAEGTSRDDLDWDKISDYADKLPGVDTYRPEDTMLRRGCLVRVGDRLLPTNAGLLLFAKDPQRWLKSAEITAVRFAGDMMGDRFSRQDIGGTLIDQIKRAETFLFDTLRRDITMGATMARQEHYEYPMEAARELLINAVAHRDYSVSGDNIRLLIFNNRMEVHSPGGLPGYMTLQNLKDERFSRNPAIVQVLSDYLYIERLGYGVDRVMELMQAQRLRAPQFIERAGSFCVTLYNTIDTAPPLPVKENILLQGIYNGMEVNPRQEMALNILRKNEAARLTNSDLQSLFPDVHSETIRRDLVDLVGKSILVKLGQKRGSYYVLRREGVVYPNDEPEE